jgi:hypothetical protein
VTTADLYRWQQRAHGVLGVMLEHGRRSDLPPLMWTLARTGAITGEAVGLGSSPAEQRAAVTAWADYLRAPVTERVDRDGTIYLYARWTWPQDDLIGGCIRATIFRDDVADGGSDG